MSVSSRWVRTTQWMLTRLTRLPEWGRARSALVVGATVAVIGFADFMTDVQISLFIFYLLPVALAVAWLGGWAGVATALICVVVRITGDMINVYPDTLPLSIWWSVSSSFVTFLVVIWILDALINLHRALEQRVELRTVELRTALQEQRRLEQALLLMGSRERAAMGRELHDELGQHFVATAMAAQVLVRRLEEENDRRVPEAKAIVRWIEEGVVKVRRFARGLLMAHIPPERLGAELGELAAACTQRAAPCHFRQDGLLVEADPAACAQLFRIAQEALSNAVRHGEARSITITLATDESATCLTVEDDGRGFAPDKIDAEGMGLRIMKDRARFIGGSLSVFSTPGEGARIVCHLPSASLALAK
jgi:signal transduction histidine kinase